MTAMLSILLLLISENILGCFTCPVYWYPSSRGTCYRAVVSEKRIDAVLYTDLCKRYGGYPATLYNTDDVIAGRNHFPGTYGAPMYIGLTDSEQDEQWLWMDGEQMSSYVSLKYGFRQPDGGNSQSCAAVDDEYLLYDYPCCDFSGSPDIFIGLCEQGNASNPFVERLIQECLPTTSTHSSNLPSITSDTETNPTTEWQTGTTVTASRSRPIFATRRCRSGRMYNGSTIDLTSMTNRLKINKNSTYAFKNKFVSAPDERKSSMVIGCVATVAVSIAFLCLFVTDMKCKRNVVAPK